MTLPKKPLKEIKSPRGQILILFLLILVVGLAIVLSVASRTVTDIRTTTTSDESNRAYFAAEAGIEEALRQLGLDPGNDADLSLDFSELNQSTATTTIEAPTTGGSIFVYPENVAKDDVIQINMKETFNDLTSDSWAGSGLRFYWGTNPGIVPNGTNQAIEISVIWHVGDNFEITKAAFDPDAGRANNFCKNVNSEPPTSLTDDTLGSDNITKDFYYSAVVDVSGADLVPGCAAGSHGPAVGGNLVMIRVRALYNTNPMPIGVTKVIATESDLYAQGHSIESSGSTGSGVTRKLEVTRLFPAVDPLFDYVLFSGSGSALQK